MTLARNTLDYWVSQLGNYALSFVTSIFVAVMLGAEGRGLLVAVILVNTLGVNLTNLGAQSASMYFVGKEPAKLAQWRAVALAWTLITGIVAFVTFMFAGAWLRNRVLSQVPALQEFPWGYMALAASMLPFSLYFFAAQGILTGLGRVRELSRFLFYYSFATNSLHLATLGIAGGFLKLDSSSLARLLILIWATSQIVAASVAHRMIAPATPARISPREIASASPAWLSYGFRAFIGSFASGLVNRMDHLFLFPMVGAVGIGIYNLSAKLAELVFQPSAAFETAGFALVARGDPRESAQLVQDLFRVNFLLNVVAISALMILSYPLVVLCYTHEYIEAVTPLRILLLCAPLMAGSRIFSLYFSAQLGRPQIPSAVGWITAIVNVALMLRVVVHHHGGLAGAAWVTTTSYGLMFILLGALFVRETGLSNPHGYFIPHRRDLDRLRKLLANIRGNANHRKGYGK